MTMRHCVYKDCENFVVHGMPTPSFTIFQFPKDLERRKLWMELGQVDPQLPASSLFMCSEHFDGKKYFSSNNRRTLLVGSAVPYAYVPLSPVNKINSVMDDEEEEMVHDEEDVLSLPEQQTMTQVVETDDDEEWNQIDEATHFIEIDDGNCSGAAAVALAEDGLESLQKNYHILDDYVTSSKSSTAKITTTTINSGQVVNRKRKIIDQTNLTSTTTAAAKIKKSAAPSQLKQVATKITTTPPKQQKQQQQHQKIENVLEEKQMPPTQTSPAADSDSEIDEGDLIDAQQVTTFIFKGEEYVQMPKDHYVQEKLALLRKLKRYERLITNIKRQVNTLDFS